MLGFVPPYLGSTLFIITVFGISGISYWVIVPVVIVMITALIVESRCQRRFVKQEITPRLRDLETLREKLTTAPCPESNSPDGNDIQ